ncbi:hypothetical protein MTO96_034300 [Rhipicephalus appendiculatus]
MVKVLGIYFGCSGVAETTWQQALERAQRVATRAENLELTLWEKAMVVKSSVCAFANHASRVAVIIGHLLWDGKPAPIKRNLLYLPTSEGGPRLTSCHGNK